MCRIFFARWLANTNLGGIVMSSTNLNNKLQAKDLINVGIFTAIYFVVYFVVMMIAYITLSIFSYSSRTAFGIFSGTGISSYSGRSLPISVSIRNAAYSSKKRV